MAETWGASPADVVAPSRSGRRRPGAAQHRPDPGLELGEAERLDQVIISVGVQREDPLGFLNGAAGEFSPPERGRRAAGRLAVQARIPHSRSSPRGHQRTRRRPHPGTRSLATPHAAQSVLAGVLPPYLWDWARPLLLLWPGQEIMRPPSSILPAEGSRRCRPWPIAARSTGGVVTSPSDMYTTSSVIDKPFKPPDAPPTITAATSAIAATVRTAAARGIRPVARHTAM